MKESSWSVLSLYRRLIASSSFQGGKEYLMRAHFGLPSVENEEQEGRPPISIKFEIPYFTVSGIQVKTTHNWCTVENRTRTCFFPYYWLSYGVIYKNPIDSAKNSQILFLGFKFAVYIVSLVFMGDYYLEILWYLIIIETIETIVFNVDCLLKYHTFLFAKELSIYSCPGYITREI